MNIFINVIFSNIPISIIIQNISLWKLWSSFDIFHDGRIFGRYQSQWKMIKARKCSLFYRQNIKQLLKLSKVAIKIDVSFESHQLELNLASNRIRKSLRSMSMLLIKYRTNNLRKAITKNPSFVRIIKYWMTKLTKLNVIVIFIQLQLYLI